MAAEFYPIPAADLEAWLRTRGFAEALPFKRERVFLLQVSPRQRIVCYTTLAVGAATVWETGGESHKGHESIRLIGMFLGREGEWRPLKAKGVWGWVRRTQGWAASLERQLAEVTEKLAGPAAVGVHPPPSAVAAREVRRTAVPVAAAEGPPLPAWAPSGPEELETASDRQIMDLLAFIEDQLHPKEWRLPQGARGETTLQVVQSFSAQLARKGTLSDKQRPWAERILREAMRRGETQAAVYGPAGPEEGAAPEPVVELVAAPEPPLSGPPPVPRAEGDPVEVDPPLAAAAVSALGALPAPTEEQARYILHPGGPALVDAVAGSGKSTAIMRRVLALACSGQDLKRVLVTTFTRAAVADMTRRWGEIAAAAGYTGSPPKIGTIHSVSAGVLRTGGVKLAGEAVGDELLKFRLADVLRRQGFDLDREADRRGEEAEDMVLDLLEAIEYYSALLPGASHAELDRLCQAAEVVAYGPLRAPLMPVGIAKRLLDEEVARKREVTYRLMLEEALKVAARSPGVRWYDHIINDEAQDDSPLQLAVLARLAGLGAADRLVNLSLVGDSIGQSIMGFQAGRPELIQGFARVAGPAVYPFTRNFRCTQEVVGAASRLLVREEHARRGAPAGAKVEYARFTSSREEGRAVAQTIQGVHDQGGRWRDCAVLYRTRARSPQVQLALWTAHIPHVLEKGASFWDASVARVVAAYLRLLLTGVTEPDFRQVMNRPFRYFPGKPTPDRPSTLEELRRILRAQGKELWDVVDPAVWHPKLQGMVQRLADDLAELDRHQDSAFEALEAIAAFANAKDGKPLGVEATILDVTEAEAEESGSTATMWRTMYEAAQSFGGDAAGLLALIVEAQHAAEVGRLLAGAKTVPEREAIYAREFGPGGAVSLVTAHSAKAREWPVVVVIGWQDEVFPHRLSLQAQGAEGEAEERRLAYVAVTRAKSRLLLTCAGHESPYTAPVLGTGAIGRPVESRMAEPYATWVAAGAMPGKAPFAVRPKVVR